IIYAENEIAVRLFGIQVIIVCCEHSSEVQRPGRAACKADSSFKKHLSVNNHRTSSVCLLPSPRMVIQLLAPKEISDKLQKYMKNEAFPSPSGENICPAERGRKILNQEKPALVTHVAQQIKDAEIRDETVFGGKNLIINGCDPIRLFFGMDCLAQI